MFDKTKIFLKKTLWIYSLNAFLKARKNTRKTRSLRDYYDKKAKELGLEYSEESAMASVQSRFKERGLAIRKIDKGKLRIFWVGAHFAQDNSGFLQGLQKYGEVLTFKNYQGGYGLAFGKNRKENNKARIENNEVLLKQVTEIHKAKPIHILMGQMWASLLDAETLIAIQKMGIPTLNVSMDDKLPDLWCYEYGRKIGSAGLVKGLDLVLTTSPETCLWYMIDGCPAVYWPLASDPEVFYPREPKIYDVVFVGGNYGERGKLVKAISDAGIKIEAFGPGFPNGFINAPKIAEVFGKAKIILGSGFVAYNKDILTIKLRDFDATMSGGLYLTNRNPDLLRLFKEGEEIECYDNFEECISKIKFYLANPEKLTAVSDAGLKKAKENYTWEKNFEKPFRAIGLI